MGPLGSTTAPLARSNRPWHIYLHLCGNSREAGEQWGSRCRIDRFRCAHLHEVPVFQHTDVVSQGESLGLVVGDSRPAVAPDSRTRVDNLDALDRSRRSASRFESRLIA